MALSVKWVPEVLFAGIQNDVRIGSSDRAFQLRWMNIIYELGLQGKNTILLIPSNIPVAGMANGQGFLPVGVLGINELAKRARTSAEKKDNDTQGST